MGWMNAVRGWFGGGAGGADVEGRPDAQDPRLYDRVADGAQLLPGEANDAQRANPDVGQGGAQAAAGAGRDDGDDLWGGDLYPDKPPPELDAPKLSRNAWSEPGEWRGIDGLWEVKLDLGRSDEGWHFGLQTSYQGSDHGGDITSGPYPTREAAFEAGHDRMTAILEPIEREAEEREEAEIARFEREHGIGRGDRGGGLER